MPKRYAAASFVSFTARAGPAPIINAATRRSQGRVRAPACTDVAALRTMSFGHEERRDRLDAISPYAAVVACRKLANIQRSIHAA